ncbi:MAG TPA: YggS family pyridoxal phosphate-dependent enzyme [Ferruginibacter sp.]|nr:YggS family pyridoxal phosphate-dependent enzyme [Ferruginibacter sp.]
MAFIKENYKQIVSRVSVANAGLVAVSKIRSVPEILEAYNEGQRDFGENYVQELMEKFNALPKDIRWHFIGHLQTNKIKTILPLTFLIHGVDSEKLLGAINKEAKKINKKISCLLQVHIAQEATKFGFNEEEILHISLEKYPFINICGLMGMASLVDDRDQIRNEFKKLSAMFDKMKPVFSKAISPVLSMGMSDDYDIALEEGSNLVRIGSLLFGQRGVK